MNRRVLFPAGMFFIVVICIALSVIAACYRCAVPSPSNFGIVFPSPNLWLIPGTWNIVLNDFLLLIGGPALYFLNKRFSLLRTPQPLGAAFLLPLCFAAFPISCQFSSAPVILLSSLAILSVLFSEYRSRNATRSVFIIATILSVGSMFDYAFIPLTIATFLASIAMEAMRPKEFLAMGMGLIAPYWVAIGTGLINPLSLRLSPPVTIFAGGIPPTLFVFLIVTGILALAAAILSIYNGVILYAGNSAVRRSIISINIFGLTAFTAMLLDISHFEAYAGVVFLWIATQFANLFSLRDMRRGMVTFWLVQTIIYASSLLYL